ncbi:MAG TPA: xanthine dehydrogenase family protein subunit M [Pseudomonadales bacterium]|jgi:carbon-monoxide dehydrogenase medium subunit
MAGFAYVAPSSIDEAVAVLAEHAGQGLKAQVIAGGTDLLVQMRSLNKAARTIVDIKKIGETGRLDIGADETFIGAGICCAALHESDELKALFPGLLESADLIGSTQIQGRATLGGNLCNASPAGDTIPAMIANAGVCVIAGPGGRRELPVEDFVVGVGRNALQDGEFLVGLKFPNPKAATADAYLRFIPRTEMDIAVAGAGVRITLDADGTCTEARVAIGAVAPTAILVPAAASALVGSKVDAGALDAAAAACSQAASPITDKRGTIEYRRRVVGVLCKRAGAIARDRAISR